MIQFDFGLSRQFYFNTQTLKVCMATNPIITQKNQFFPYVRKIFFSAVTSKSEGTEATNVYLNYTSCGLLESSPYTQDVEGVVSSPHHRSGKRSLLVKGSLITESLPAHATRCPNTHLSVHTSIYTTSQHKVVLFVYCFDLFTRCRGNTE